MKKITALILAVLLALSLAGCGGDSVDMSTGELAIGSVRFSLVNAEDVEKRDELLYRFTLVEDEAWMTVLASDISGYDTQMAEELVKIQQTTFLSEYPGRTNESSRSLSFADVSFPCTAYETRADGVTLYNLTGSFLYEGYVYTLNFYSTSSAPEAVEPFTNMLTSSALLTTGDLWLNGRATDTEETEPQASIVSGDLSGLFATGSEENALKTALRYLEAAPFSHSGLIGQLEFDGYTTKEATYAADHCGADWNEQAVLCAKEYLNTTAFSAAGLTDQLIFEGFTAAEAAHGVRNCGADWNAQALLCAKAYLKTAAFSQSGLMAQLEFEGFTAAEANHGVLLCDADWLEQAVRCARSYLKSGSYTRDELIDQLEYEGFTNQQAVYGVQKNGY